MTKDELLEQLQTIQDGLEFDEASHVYTRNGIILPSVTTIMKPLTQSIYDAIPSDVLANAAQRGTSIHRAVEFYEQYGWDKVDTLISGYVEAWKKFRADHPTFEIVASEQRGYHPVYGFAGTMDIVGIDSKYPKHIQLMDIKTGSVASPMTWAVQLSAYEEMLKYGNVGDVQKSVIHLMEDGTYKLYPIKDNEFLTFIACITIRNYQEKMKGE